MKNATMMITGNSIAELRSNLNALEAAINSGARMGVGGTSLEDVKAEIEDIDGITEIGAQILDEVLGIINRKIKEIKHE